MNILSNAVKYNKENGYVYISCREIPSKQTAMTTLEFVCRDTGIGMTEAFQKRIFEPFAQEHAGSRTKFAGTGLGMPITKKLVEKMGGTISFESKEGTGTTFVIRIPFRIDTDRKDRTETEEKTETSIQGLHVLLTEDNELNMEIAEFVLQNEGAVVTKAWNGQKAVDIFRKSRPGEFDAILMDIMMPVMNGYEAAKMIRSLDREDAKVIPIIAMTANAFTEDKMRAKEAGMDEHIAKPVDRKLLVKVINELVKRQSEGEVIMKKKKWNRLVSVLLVMVTVLSLLSGCGGKSAEKEDAETITVYLWTTKLYEKYAPYIQEQLPDINVEFVVGNNDLDFYRFLDENGGLPDIITCCRFSLHDASPLKDSLMDLSTTNAAGAVYDTYLNSFRNQDGSVNWLPVCADAHGFVVNKDLFEKYDIPLPTDYESFVSACQAFDEVGIRGFTADYYYDYTCMETLQGLSASELSSVDGRKWRTIYSDPDNTKREGLDSTVWPEAFERMEQFIQDTGLSQDDLDMNYDDVVEMYKNGKLAMYFGSSSGVKMFQDQGINTTFLPFFQQNGEKWLMTTPYFQIALNRDLTKDETRRQKAMKVLNTMLSEDAQNRIIYDGQDLLSYSQDVDFQLTEYLKDVKSVIEENHMYIRIASNDFFSVSRDVVSKMISGEYNAEQAYQSFNSQLLEEKSTSEDIVLDSKKTYSNRFHTSGGNEAYSVMANTLRSIYGTDVLIATGNSFTGNVLKAGYTEKMAGNMIMPNELSAYSSEMSGAELKETVRNFVEGYQGGFIPFNRGSLPVFSGISVEVKETDNGYTLSKVTKDGKQIQDKNTFTVTCLAAPQYMEAYAAEENIVFDGGIPCGRYLDNICFRW